MARKWNRGLEAGRPSLAAREQVMAREQAKELAEKYHAKVNDLWRNGQWGKEW